MILTVESKTLVDSINAVTSTTGADTVNLEIGKGGSIQIKSNSKGCSHYLKTDMVAESFTKNFKVAVNSQQIVGLINRKGEIKIEVSSDNILQISNKRFNAQINLIPAVDLDKIEQANSDSIVVLEPNTLTAMWDRLSGVEISNQYQDSKPFVRIRCKDGLLEMGSSDSVHMVYFRIDVDPEQAPFEFDLDPQLLRKLLSIIVDNPESRFAIEDTRVYVQSSTQTISFPKQQGGGRLTGLDMLHTLANKLSSESNNSSYLAKIKLEELTSELSGCRFIATDKAALEISGSKNGKNVNLSYRTSFGSYKALVSCTAHWEKGEVFKIDPFLFEDLLGTLSLYESVDLYSVEGKLFSHIQGDGYESFHICSGN